MERPDSMRPSQGLRLRSNGAPSKKSKSNEMDDDDDNKNQVTEKKGDINMSDTISDNSSSGDASSDNTASLGSAGSSNNNEDNVAILPLSMQLIRPFWSICCQDCEKNNRYHDFDMKDLHEAETAAAENAISSPSVSLAAPRLSKKSSSLTPYTASPEILIAEYTAACHLYGCADRINAGVLTTLRFKLPAMRVSGDFHDADMLALGELMLKHCDGALSYIKILDFSIASREGRLLGRYGLRSHGAYTLSKVLQASKHIEEVFLQRNRIGPYGASALFAAAARNPVMHTMVLRNCGVGERGAFAFANTVCSSTECGLQSVDISVNSIGFAGCVAIEQAMRKRPNKRRLEVDLEGNLVLQEVMNSITHGLGILLALLGSVMLSRRVKDKDPQHVISCAVYSLSLVVLYTFSTLYHSFFALQATKYIFEVFDHCAIYILIAGSYTPFLRIVLGHNPLWSFYLLFFIWACCVCGIWVEAFRPVWKHKSKFTLCMYLGMGWSCLVCLPELVTIIPKGAMSCLVLGGVGYTSGIPFFVRNNNLDHSVWHCFVLAGSIFHWCGIYFYVADWPTSN